MYKWTVSVLCELLYVSSDGLKQKMTSYNEVNWKAFLMYEHLFVSSALLTSTGLFALRTTERYLQYEHLHVFCIFEGILIPHNNWTVFTLYEFLNVLSAGYVVQKTLDKEYNWMVSPLYEFLYANSDLQSVQKILDKEYNWMVSLLYEFLNVLSERQVVQKTLDKEYNWMVSLLCELWREFWALIYP